MLDFLVTIEKKQIAVMLDIERTSEDITDELAEIFVRQLNFLRLKFHAEEGLICLSTHYRDSLKMQPILESLSRHLTSHIKFGLHFYYGGLYDYEEKEEIDVGNSYDGNYFNRDKVETFFSYKIEDPTIKNQWFAIIDDSLFEDEYKKYQNIKPCAFLKPSAEEEDLKYNNFMNLATTTHGFQGVIEMLASYIERIKKLNENQILEQQENMITHLSSLELRFKLRDKNYSFIAQYLQEGYADEDDYGTILHELNYINREEITEEHTYIERIISLLEEKWEQTKDFSNLKRLKEIKKDKNK